MTSPVRKPKLRTEMDIKKEGNEAAVSELRKSMKRNRTALGEKN